MLVSDVVSFLSNTKVYISPFHSPTGHFLTVFPLYDVASCSFLHLVPYRRSQIQAHLRSLSDDAGSGKSPESRRMSAGLGKVCGSEKAKDKQAQALPRIHF